MSVFKEALKLKSESTSPEFRLELILGALGLSLGDYGDTIHEFIGDTSLEPGFRAAIIFLAIKGRYPTAAQVEKIVALLNAGDGEKAIIKLRASASFGDRRRLLLPVDEILVDVTRYSRTSEISGIPRVVKNLITSSPFEGSSHGVWSDLVFGPVQLSSSGFVYFHKAVWGKLRNSHYLYYFLRKFYFSKSISVLQRGSMIHLLKILKKLGVGRILLRLVDTRAPRVCYIINPRRLVIPEVPDVYNSELLRVWIDNININESICIVHDLLPLTHPHFFPEHAFAEHQEYLKLLQSCKTLVVGTPLLAEDLRERLQLPESNTRIKCIPLPVNLSPKGPSSQIQVDPRLTFIGGYQERKGLKELVDFLEVHDNLTIKFDVAVVGSPNLLRGHEEAQLFSRVNQEKNIYEVHQSLMDSELADLIQSSSAIIYISSAEGYGLPILEALSLGVPVVAQRTPLNEHFASKYGGIHLVSKPYSLHDLHALNEIAEQGPLWQNLKKSIKTSHLPVNVEKWAHELLLA